MRPTADIAVVGGGVVGLAMARQIMATVPDARVAVFDKEADLGAHASGRNSGVLHAGFYYAPDSLKAGLTRRGNQMLHEFCDEHGVLVSRCGKVVVAAGEPDLPRLAELYRRGLANGVPLQMLDEQALAEVEPLARTFGRALWSPSTSVADPHEVIAALADDVRRAGARVELRSQATAGRPGGLIVAGRRWDVGHVVNCAGLYADVVASWFGFCDDYVVLPFKGLYWYADWPAGRLRRHVYPVPDPADPFLGVHLTVTATGGAKVGPTAIPALWREDYGGLRNFSAAELRQVARHLPALAASPHHDTPHLLRTELPKHSRRVLVGRARAMVPSIEPRHFRIKGRTGVRAQLWSRKNKKLEMDFIVRGDDSSTHLLNIVSPGWTSALAMAESVVAGMVRRGVL